jgi:hypothetical protein
MQPVVRKPDSQVIIRNQNPFNHARQDRAKTEVLIGDTTRNLLILVGEFLQISMDFT